RRDGRALGLAQGSPVAGLLFDRSPGALSSTRMMGSPPRLAVQGKGPSTTVLPASMLAVASEGEAGGSSAHARRSGQASPGSASATRSVAIAPNAVRWPRLRTRT